MLSRWHFAASVCVVLLVCAWFGVADVPSAHAQDVTPQRVTFTTSDGVELVADFHLPPAAGDDKPPIAILLHMYRHDRKTFGPLIPVLLDEGIAALAVDMRGHGESIGPKEMRLPARVAERDKSVFATMYRDVEAAYRWLADQGRVDLTRVGLIGASVGCSVALDYAARDRSIDAIVCLTPGTDYLGLDSIADIQRVRQRAILLLASEAERAACDELGKACVGAACQVYDVPVQNSSELHGTRMFGRISGVEERIAKFLADKLIGPSSDPVAASVRGRVYYPAGAPAIGQIKPENVRWFSSPAEAEARGLTPSKSDEGSAEERVLEDGTP